MASEGSRMKKYNHLENQTLKVVTLLNSHKFASSMGDEGSQLRGVYEDLHTLSNGSRPREGWKSHVQKKVKGPESHAALVRERGLVGLPLFSEEVAAQRMAQSRRAAEAAPLRDNHRPPARKPGAFPGSASQALLADPVQTKQQTAPSDCFYFSS